MKGVGHVEHIVTVARPSLGILAGKVFLHVIQGQQLLVEVLHGELIVLGYIDLHEVLLPNEQLLLREDLLGVVLGEHRVWAYIILPN